MRRLGAVDGGRVLVKAGAELGKEGDEVGCFGGVLGVLPVDIEAIEAEAGELVLGKEC